MFMVYVPITRASWKVTLITRIYTRSMFSLSGKIFLLGLELRLLMLSAKAQNPIVWFGSMTPQNYWPKIAISMQITKINHLHTKILERLNFILNELKILFRVFKICFRVVNFFFFKIFSGVLNNSLLLLLLLLLRRTHINLKLIF